jgi:hypothetical protein
MSSFLSWLQSTFIVCLQYYSAFILKAQKDYPLFFRIVNEIHYLSDCYINGKLIEPFDWEICYCYFDKNYEYKEDYETKEYSDMRKILVLEKCDNFIKVANKIHNKAINTVKYRFLSIVYECNGEKVEFNISDEYYIEENEILSELFVARYLKHHFPQTPFNLSYTLDIVDFDLNSITLKSNSYLLLDKTNYRIIYNETQTPSPSVDSQLFDIHKKTI